MNLFSQQRMKDFEYETIADVEFSHWWFQNRFIKVKNILRAQSQRSRSSLKVFDIGCGTGGLLVQLKKESFIKSVSGCEPNPIGIQFCKDRGISILECRIDEIKQGLSSYDSVLCMDVLYHKDVDPRKGFKVINQLLKPGGTLILNVAAMPCLKNAHDENSMGVRRFRVRELKSLALKNDFKIINLHHWNIFLTPAIYLKAKFDNLFPSINTHQSSLKLPNKLINNFFKIILQFEDYLSNWIKFPFGTSLFLVCIRNN